MDLPLIKVYNNLPSQSSGGSFRVSSARTKSVTCQYHVSLVLGLLRGVIESYASSADLCNLSIPRTMRVPVLSGSYFLVILFRHLVYIYSRQST